MVKAWILRKESSYF